MIYAILIPKAITEPLFNTCIFNTKKFLRLTFISKHKSNFISKFHFGRLKVNIYL